MEICFVWSFPMFKHLLAISFLASTPAFSADLLMSEEPTFAQPSEVSFSDWSGLRLSLSGGGGLTRGRAERGDIDGVLIPYDVSNGLFPDDIEGSDVGLVGTIGVGYDIQSGNWVGGIALDASISTVEGRNNFERVDPNPSAPFAGVHTITDYHTDLEHLGTARLRVGYSFGNTLLVGTAGIAAGSVSNKLALTIPELAYASPEWSESSTEIGFVVGASVERKLTENIILSLGVQYVDLGDVTVNAADPVTFPGERFAYKFDNTFATTKVGLHYKF